MYYLLKETAQLLAEGATNGDIYVHFLVFGLKTSQLRVTSFYTFENPPIM
jgi:hypothetical protein